jgi:hypothetical protein
MQWPRMKRATARIVHCVDTVEQFIPYREPGGKRAARLKHVALLAKSAKLCPLERLGGNDDV